MVDRVLALPEGTRLYLLAPIVRGRKGEYRKELAELQKSGFQRVKIDGAFHEIAEAPALDKKLKHDIEVVVDRIVVRRRHRHPPRGLLPDRAGARRRHRHRRVRGCDRGRTPTAPAEGEGRREAPGGGQAGSLAERATDAERIIFSEKFACPVSGFTIPEIEPRLFSFNNPYGACPVCDGLGTERMVDPALVVPDETLSLRDGAIAPWAKTSSPYYLQTLEALASHYKFSIDTPWAKLPEKAQDVDPLRHRRGRGHLPYDDGLRAYKTTKTFEGVIPNLERRWKETDSAWMREEIERYHSAKPCAPATASG